MDRINNRTARGQCRGGLRFVNLGIDRGAFLVRKSREHQCVSVIEPYQQVPSLNTLGTQRFVECEDPKQQREDYWYHRATLTPYALMGLLREG